MTRPPAGYASLKPLIIGDDPALRAVVARAMRVAPTRVPVLIGGESGTGKELLAELIHRMSPCADGPLVAVNCGTLPRELAESELFGHERGAFTGAARQKAGWFEEADGGTLVLDEVGELPLDLQPKLLRVLETGRLRRVGGSGEVRVKVRIVAMSLRDLRQDTARGKFRIDLYHRLAGFDLTVPPLRRRKADIPLLAAHFLADQETELGASVGSNVAARRIDPAALEELQRHDWPGNIRELRNVLRRAAVLSSDTSDTIAAEALELPRAGCLGPMPAVSDPAHHLADGDGPAPATPATLYALSSTRDATSLGEMDEPGLDSGVLTLPGRTFDQIERAVFGWALHRNGGSRRRAARALGLPRSSFCDKVKRHGLV